jgi:transcriptional regulator with XRE-family HTH domain
MKFSQFMELKFIEYQRHSGGRKTVADFASFLGIAQTTLSSYMNDKRMPGDEYIEILASKLGMEVYDALGLPRPDPDLLFIQTAWGELDEDTRKRLRDLAEDAKVRNLNVSKKPATKPKPQATG